MIEAATIHPASSPWSVSTITQPSSRSTIRALLEIIRYTYENGIPSNDRVNYYTIAGNDPRNVRFINNYL